MLLRKNRLFVCGMMVLFMQSAYPLFDDDETVIWKAGLNLYFKYAKQDSTKFGANEHPITLNAKDVKLALKALTFNEKKFLSAERIRPVFASLQLNLLSTHLVAGLEKAQPEQDIIFVMEGGSRSLGVLSRKNFVAGRVFYKNNQLNIILGEYDKTRNDAFESVYDPSGQARVPYSFNYGRRNKEAKQFNAEINAIDGFSYQRFGNKQRQDWLLIDVAAAAKAYLQKTQQAEQVTTAGANAATLNLLDETARLAQQRREMRVEMARMRKEMKSLGVMSAEHKSPQERMAELQDLLDKGWISQQEYDDKRQTVLDDI